eukprot:TRINITY_DN1004_c0_g1_i3.p1 TRINITY_DN1004_c0_g1~~TRINITY_DN1004_c0_g1_i3.p1  ORF type:complete len:435 (-),score=58.08 TRINITY_DN1004_c0_g1_i3:44-1348(-)
MCIRDRYQRRVRGLARRLMGSCTSADKERRPDANQFSKAGEIISNPDGEGSSDPSPAWSPPSLPQKLPFISEDSPRSVESKVFQDAADAATAQKVANTRLFGCTLAQASERSAGGTPAVVRECCRWLREHGLCKEGLFRIPGRKRAVDHLVNLFNVSSSTRINPKEAVANVTSLLVRWLMLLEDEEGNRAHLHIRRDEATHANVYNLQSQTDRLREHSKFGSAAEFTRGCIQKLDPIQQSIYKEIAGLLSEACKPDNATVNKMDAAKLALCATPDILGMMVVMISQFEEVFDEPTQEELQRQNSGVDSKSTWEHQPLSGVLGVQPTSGSPPHYHRTPPLSPSKLGLNSEAGLELSADPPGLHRNSLPEMPKLDDDCPADAYATIAERPRRARQLSHSGVLVSSSSAFLCLPRRSIRRLSASEPIAPPRRMVPVG